MPGSRERISFEREPLRGVIVTGNKNTICGRRCQVDKKKIFSERLYDIMMDLLSSQGAKEITGALGVQENYFAPSKYNLKRFKGKAISHLDSIEEYFGVDLLGGTTSALARELEGAERNGILSQHDRKAIRSILGSARAHAGSRGQAAVEKVKKASSKKKR